MSADAERRGMVFLCGEDGTIQRILRDDLGLSDRARVGSPIQNLVDPNGREKLAMFLTEVQQRQAAYDWEIVVPVGRTFLLLNLAGAQVDAGYLVMAFLSGPGLAHLDDEDPMRINHEQPNVVRLTAEELAPRHRIVAVEDAGTYDALSRLNNELANLQRELARRTAELERYQDAVEEEQRIASHLMNQLVRAGQLCDPLFRHWIQPAQNLSGDLIAAARTPGGVLHVLLADGTGHGLAASLNVLPLVDPFYAMTAKGLGISALAREINDKTRRWLPLGRFVAAALIAFDPDRGQLEVWCGGVPPPFLLDASGAMVHEFTSMHVAFGVLSSREFSAETEVLRIDRPSQLIVCSDGVTDAQGADGEQFGRERLMTTLRDAPAGERLDRLKHNLALHLADRPAIDDISIALVDCAPATLGRR